MSILFCFKQTKLILIFPCFSCVKQTELIPFEYILFHVCRHDNATGFFLILCCPCPCFGCRRKRKKYSGNHLRNAVLVGQVVRAHPLAMSHWMASACIIPPWYHSYVCYSISFIVLLYNC